MKFAKGLLTEEEDSQAAAKPVGKKMNWRQPGAAPPQPKARPVRPAAPALKEDRLFETQTKTISSSRNYLKVIAVVAILVLGGWGAFIYLTLPGIGDKVRG